MIYGGDTLIDLSGDTVTAQQLLSGVTAHDRAGNKIVGSYNLPSGTKNITNNGSFDVFNFATAVGNVEKEFEHQVSGQFVGSNQATITLNTGSFAPRVAIIAINDAIFNTATSTYYYGFAFCYFDKNGNIVFQRTDFLSDGGGSGARLGRASSGFSRSGNSITFTNGSSFLFRNGIPYQYYMWG